MERLKAFIANPSIIEDIVVRQRLNQDEHKPTPYDGSFAASTNFVIFRAAWQTNAVLFYQVTNEHAAAEFLPGRRIISVLNGQSWLLDGRDFVETCSADSGTMSNPVVTTIRFKLAPLHQVLQGGVLHVRPGDLRWTGNTFVAEDVQTIYGFLFRVEGRLVEDEGRASEMIVTYTGRSASGQVWGRWRVKYSYERRLGADFFPSRITGFSMQGAREVEIYDFEVLKLQPRSDPLPDRVFDPKPVIEARPMPIHLFTNGAFYLVQQGGALLRLQSPSQSGRFPGPPGAIHRIVALGPTLGINYLFLAALVRALRKRKGKNTQRKEHYEETTTTRNRTAARGLGGSRLRRVLHGR